MLLCFMFYVLKNITNMFNVYKRKICINKKVHTDTNHLCLCRSTYLTKIYIITTIETF